VDGDKILYVCGSLMKDMGKLGNTKIVTTVMSNIGLYKAFDELGIGYEKTAVGDKYVYENMRENGHLLGGEQSGHIIFGKLATTGDGVLTAIKIMQAILEKKTSLSKLTEKLHIYPQLLKNALVKDKDVALNAPEVQAAAKAAEELLGSDGRILLRKSGTEPLVRVMAEAPTDELCLKCVDAILDAIDKAGLLLEVR